MPRQHITFEPVQGLEPEKCTIHLTKPSHYNEFFEVYYIEDVDGEHEWVTDPSRDEIIKKTGWVRKSILKGD